jgi:hypothetical protein
LWSSRDIKYLNKTKFVTKLNVEFLNVTLQKHESSLSKVIKRKMKNGKEKFSLKQLAFKLVECIDMSTFGNIKGDGVARDISQVCLNKVEGCRGEMEERVLIDFSVP